MVFRVLFLKFWCRWLKVGFCSFSMYLFRVVIDIGWVLVEGEEVIEFRK